MVSNTTESKVATEGNFVDVQKYVGVASIKIVAVNPNNAKLRAFGWNIPEDAEEPKYVSEKTLDDGTKRVRARVRFLVQIQDLVEKPIIALDFYLSPEPWMNNDKTKVQVIDQYGRTCWATRDEYKAQAIPQYSNGPAKIATPYKTAAKGQEELVKFLMKFLCVAPYEIYNMETGKYVINKTPGMLTIDNWKALCEGNAREIEQDVALRPENILKVILCIRQTDDNKSYQDFVTDTFIGNGATPGNNGMFSGAEKAIEKLKNDGRHENYVFYAGPVKAFNITPDVEEETKPDTDDDIDDLPFE